MACIETEGTAVAACCRACQNDMPRTSSWFSLQRDERTAGCIEARLDHFCSTECMRLEANRRGHLYRGAHVTLAQPR